MERLKEAVARSKGNQSYSGSVMWIGFDDSDKILSEMGHRAGDRLLVEVAQRLRGDYHADHTIARMEKAEFSILMDGVDAVVDSTVCNDLLEKLRKPFLVMDQPISLVPSVGVCSIGPDYKSVDGIVRDADTAMFRAKRQGGSRCVWYEESLNSEMQSLVQKKRDLDYAIKNHQLELYYQPQLDVLTTPPRLCAVEALVRWNHPSLGLLAPDKFMPLAEKTGLIVPLGLYVIRAACAQLKKWQSNVLHPDFSLSINLCGPQLSDPSFFADLVDILAETEIDPHVLQLEVPESVFIEESGIVREVLTKLRELGIRITLDNFGRTGSSITQLDAYPVDALKLDKSLIASFNDSTKKIEMAKSVIGYARTIDLTPFAQGVESTLQSKALQRCGCTIIQGNFYSAPVPASEITKLLDEGTRTLTYS